MTPMSENVTWMYACDMDVSLTDTHVIVSYRLSDSTDIHVSLIDTHVGTTLLTWMLKVLTWMSVWHLGPLSRSATRVRNGRTTARGSARAAERALLQPAGPGCRKAVAGVGRKVRGAREDRGARGGPRGLEAVEGARPSAPDGRTATRAPPGAPVF